MADRALLLALAFALAGCQGDEPHLTREDALRAEDDAPVRLHWLGESFEGLPLTRAERGVLIYGECNGEGSGDSFHCTGPQVQVQHWALARRHPRMFDVGPTAGCARGRIGERVVAAFVTSGGLEVYVGGTVVVLFADDGRVARAARALRPLSDAATGEPPPSVGVALRRCDLRLAEVLGRS